MVDNVGTADLARAHQMRDAMEDTIWFRAKAGEGKTWGKDFIRVLPPHTNMDGLFFWSVPLHFDIGPGKQNLPCPRRAQGGGCPICGRGFEQRGKISDDEFRKFMPSWQAYMNIVVLNEDGTPKEDPPRVRVWSVSRKVLDPLLDDFDENGDFTHLETGRNLRVSRRGVEFKTEYRLKFGPASKVEYLDLVSELRDLQTISPYVDPEKLLLALDAPAGGQDPWASAQAPPSGAREPDQITQGSGSPFGPDPDEDDEATDAAEASMPEKGGRATQPDAPPASEEERKKARQRLQEAAQPKSEK